MLKKKFLAFVLCLKFFITFAQDQTGQVSLDNPNDSKSDISWFITTMLQLDELAKPYCQKYSTILPIWCGHCKERKLYLGEFPGYLFGLALKDASDGKNIGNLKTTFEDFLKLLTATDAKESDVVDFVLKKTKELEYHCTNCQSTEWENTSKI
jgi:hypothetical protein